jgi:hypothetical protein
MNWKELNLSSEVEKLCNDFKYRTVANFNRLLFDFFDEQGIIVEIEYNWGTLKFNPIVNSDDVSVTEYETRQEAEEKAFKKAFQLLEEKLNRGKK